MNLIAGVTEAAGSNIQWLCDQFFRTEQKELGEGIYKYMDEVISSIPAGSDHLICTPWMSGERCPVSSTTTFPSGVLTILNNSCFGRDSFVITHVLKGIFLTFIFTSI